MKTCLILLLWLTASTAALCQDSNNIKYYITANGNLYIPTGDSQKGVYPILWFDKETEPKVLLGGLGIGLSALKNIKPKLSVKGQANISKHTYWDEPFQARNAVGANLGSYTHGSSDYSIGITATAHFHLSQKFSVGTGIGSQILLISLSRQPEIEHLETSSIAINNYYKRVMPTVPVEVSYTTHKMLFNIRYEQALLNRYKGELQNYKKDNYGLLFFEIGLRVN